MTKIVWLSDLHFLANGDVLGHDPRARLDAAIRHINAHHADADLCVISGDLVNRGTVGDYAALAERLKTLAIPYFPMVGNHDNRDLLRTFLALPDQVMPGFVQYAIPTEDAALICLDTQKTGSGAGAFCQERLDWLDAALTDAADRPVVLFMHHPPASLGLPMQDSENNLDGARLLELLSNHDNLRYMCIGHVHRPVTGTYSLCHDAFATLSGTATSTALGLGQLCAR